MFLTRDPSRKSTVVLTPEVAIKSLTSNSPLYVHLSFILQVGSSTIPVILDFKYGASSFFRASQSLSISSTQYCEDRRMASPIAIARAARITVSV